MARGGDNRDWVIKITDFTALLIRQGVLEFNCLRTGRSGHQAAAQPEGSFTFLLPTESGFTYDVQSKTNLNDAVWSFERTVSGDGTVKSIAVPAGSSSKFIRVAVRL